MEANALLRARLNIAPDAVLPPLSSLEGISRKSDLSELGPAMQSLLLRDRLDPAATVDLLDRLVSGGAGKGVPRDLPGARRLGEAARKAPKDVQRPLKYVEPGEMPTKRKGGRKSKSSTRGTSGNSALESNKPKSRESHGVGSRR